MRGSIWWSRRMADWGFEKKESKKSQGSDR